MSTFLKDGVQQATCATQMQPRVYVEGFNHDLVDLFYSLVEAIQKLIFEERINPVTGIPYMEQPEPFEDNVLAPSIHNEVNQSFYYQYAIAHDLALIDEEAQFIISLDSKGLLVHDWISDTNRPCGKLFGFPVQDMIDKKTECGELMFVLRIFFSISRTSGRSSVALEHELQRRLYMYHEVIPEWKTTLLGSVSLASQRRLGADMHAAASSVLGDPYLLEMIGKLHVKALCDELLMP